MKKFLSRISTAAILSFGLWGAFGQVAHAQEEIGKLFGYGIDQLVMTSFAWLSSQILILASWFLTMTGMIMNVSLTLTLQMRDFIDNMPVIYEVWQAIRDISGLFLIFFILWAAFQIILGLQSPKFGELIKNLIVAGVLINFSFFFASVLIDASNLVSFQIYRQMIPDVKVSEVRASPSSTINSRLCPPQSTTVETSSQSIIKKVTCETYYQGGISDIFMSAFNVTQFYNNNGQFNPSSQEQQPLKTQITLVQLTGAVAMFMAGFLFLFGALAFLFRIGILIFILAFSPIFFASYVVPKIGSWAKKGVDIFTGQLIFMPVFLLLMYVALKVIATGNFTGVALNANVAGAKDFALNMIALGANFFFVFVLLSIPFMAAMELGGQGAKLAGSWTKSARGWMTNAMGTRTLGRVGSSVDKWASNTRFGNSQLGRDLRASTTGALAGAKFGGKKSWEDTMKAQKEIKSKDKEIRKEIAFNRALNETQKGSRPVLADLTALKDSMAGMTEKQRLALGKDKLKDPNVLRYLTKDNFAAIKKSDDFSEEDKKEITDARKKTFEDAIRNGRPDLIKDMAKNMSGGELMSIEEKDLLAKEEMLEHLTPEQLKALDDGGLESSVRAKIGKGINEWANSHDGKNHRAVGYIRKNKEAWGIA